MKRACHTLIDMKTMNTFTRPKPKPGNKIHLTEPGQNPKKSNSAPTHDLKYK